MQDASKMRAASAEKDQAGDEGSRGARLMLMGDLVE